MKRNLSDQEINDIIEEFNVLIVFFNENPLAKELYRKFLKDKQDKINASTKKEDFDIEKE